MSHPCTSRLSRPSPRSRGPTGTGRRPRPRRRPAIVGGGGTSAVSSVRRSNAPARSTAGARTTITSSAVRSIVCDRRRSRAKSAGRSTQYVDPAEVQDVHERRLVGVVRVHVERREDRAARVEDAVDGPAAHVLTRVLVAVGDVGVLARRQVEPLHPVVVAAVVEHEHAGRVPPREPERLGLDVGREVGGRRRSSRPGPVRSCRWVVDRGLRLGVVPDRADR